MAVAPEHTPLPGQAQPTSNRQGISSPGPWIARRQIYYSLNDGSRLPRSGTSPGDLPSGHGGNGNTENGGSACPPHLGVPIFVGTLLSGSGSMTLVSTKWGMTSGGGYVVGSDVYFCLCCGKSSGFTNLGTFGSLGYWISCRTTDLVRLSHALWSAHALVLQRRRPMGRTNLGPASPLPRQLASCSL